MYAGEAHLLCCVTNRKIQVKNRTNSGSIYLVYIYFEVFIYRYIHQVSGSTTAVVAPVLNLQHDIRKSVVIFVLFCQPLCGG